MDPFVDNCLDASLESSGFVEVSQEWSEKVVYRPSDFKHPGHFGDYLHLLLQQKERKNQLRIDFLLKICKLKDCNLTTKKEKKKGLEYGKDKGYDCWFAG